MNQFANERTSSNIAITVTPQQNGHYICEAVPSIMSQTDSFVSAYGQHPKHAIANALERIALQLRLDVEADQNIDADEVERTDDGEIIEKTFHIVVHYETVYADQSKFDAMVETQMGNTMVERGDFSMIQIDPELPIEPLTGSYRYSQIISA